MKQNKNTFKKKTGALRKSVLTVKTIELIFHL